MGWMSSDIVHVLIFLLPGFLTAAIFHSLTPTESRRPLSVLFQHLFSQLSYNLQHLSSGISFQE